MFTLDGIVLVTFSQCKIMAPKILSMNTHAFQDGLACDRLNENRWELIPLPNSFQLSELQLELSTHNGSWVPAWHKSFHTTELWICGLHLCKVCRLPMCKSCVFLFICTCSAITFIWWVEYYSTKPPTSLLRNQHSRWSFMQHYTMCNPVLKVCYWQICKQCDCQDASRVWV